jgi:acyl-CoA synthetase (AMP-forming)/AMP-acid ligase II
MKGGRFRSLRWKGSRNVRWNYADVYEAIARVMPDVPCQVQGDRSISWDEFDRRSNALANAFLAAGLSSQAKVAVYLRNCPEFLEAYVACFKARLVPANVNYRYEHDELVHVIGNADAEALVFHASYAPMVARFRESLPQLRRFVAVDDGSPLPEWAEAYDEVVEDGVETRPGVARSGEDSLLLYTGGTTGLPKGVLWQQNEVIRALGTAGNFYLGEPPAADLEDAIQRLDRSGKRLYVACPLMHATGLFTSLTLMNAGWTIETTASQRFDAASLWRVASDHRVNALVIVGDAFAQPLLAELDANAGSYDLSRLQLIVSSGSKFSRLVRAGLLGHLPWLVLSDNYGSSEALRGVQTYSRGDTVPEDAVIARSEVMQMMNDDGELLDMSVPGTSGTLLIKGHLAEGYYKDPEKSRATYVTIDGTRYCVTGDFGVVEPDGNIRLMGRGSSVINTGGEKVFPYEVEMVIRKHEAVKDAAVIGLPHERFGQAVAAAVVLREGAGLDRSALAEHVKRHLAAYKAPREMFVVDSIPRTAAGKIDHKACLSIVQATAS